MFDADTEKKNRKNLYLWLILAAIFVSAAVYTYFSIQTKIYKSVGKFAVFYSQKTTSTGELSTSTDLTKSVSESIKTRNFLESISSYSKVTFSKEDLDNGIGNIVKADVVTNSNIITVEFDSTNKSNLDKINNVFLATLNSSKIVSDKDSSVVIKTIDPLYTYNDPVYPEPLKYAIIALAAVLFMGLLMIYTLLG